ncbi:hypothetical protein MYCTH_2134674 [Thermothelomyces thermophilus ATCC 42464]|uniref:Uncharacterized protein n=1 Tax=Thermothelomyces thermophilus (strain ATCC 42464 / BCRC 31852 / DSM 1799) TaxID=573729 RepID=G2QHP6_THET4|nr:uncharacterized protein MYCTH_2134674 [Thermothelomyces thermophilus ATCC 42464]AEO58906.1 hypothetical protein MYCTH_2134674 [Thermothelomyces thermophilus ATCC 42464]
MPAPTATLVPVVRIEMGINKNTGQAPATFNTSTLWMRVGGPVELFTPPQQQAEGLLIRSSWIASQCVERCCHVDGASITGSAVTANLRLHLSTGHTWPLSMFERRTLRGLTDRRPMSPGQGFGFCCAEDAGRNPGQYLPDLQSEARAPSAVITDSGLQLEVQSTGYIPRVH